MIRLPSSLPTSEIPNKLRNPFVKSYVKPSVREKELLSRYRAQFEGNLLCFVRACTHVCALMTQKLCAVGMRNAKLRNHLKCNTSQKQKCIVSQEIISNHIADNDGCDSQLTRQCNKIIILLFHSNTVLQCSR